MNEIVGGGFGEEMPSLLLTQEWLEYRGYDLADREIYLTLRLFEWLGYGGYDLTIYRYKQGDKKLTF